MHRHLLASFLGCDVNELAPCDWFQKNAFNYKGTDYFIFTEPEANTEARKHVFSYMGSFNTKFVLKHLKVEVNETRLKKVLQKNDENSIEALALFLKSEKEFLNDAIRTYGRPYFICFGDKTEYTIEGPGGTYYIYRLV